MTAHITCKRVTTRTPRETNTRMLVSMPESQSILTRAVSLELDLSLSLCLSAASHTDTCTGTRLEGWYTAPYTRPRVCTRLTTGNMKDKEVRTKTPLCMKQSLVYKTLQTP